MYKRVYWNKSQEIMSEMISQDEYLNIERKVDDGFIITSMEDYFIMVKDNCNDLILQLSEDKMKKLFFEKEAFALPTLNRLFYNVLCSFYAYTEFLENNFKEDFAKIKTHYYDNYFSYRTAVNLRRYMTHRALGITGTGIFSKDASCHAYIEIGSLVSQRGNKIQSGYRQEINLKKIELIDLTDLMKDFVTMFIEFQKTLYIEIMVPRLSPIIEDINSQVVCENGERFQTYYTNEDGQGTHLFLLDAVKHFERIVEIFKKY